LKPQFNSPKSKDVLEQEKPKQRVPKKLQDSAVR
jgi:hypothetical protein